jgi:hypothetical protein
MRADPTNAGTPTRAEVVRREGRLLDGERNDASRSSGERSCVGSRAVERAALPADD